MLYAGCVKQQERQRTVNDPDKRCLNCEKGKYSMEVIKNNVLATGPEKDPPSGVQAHEPEPVETSICKAPACPAAGALQPVEKFNRNFGGTGTTDPYCKACRVRIMIAGRKNKAAERRKESLNTTHALDRAVALADAVASTAAKLSPGRVEETPGLSPADAAVPLAAASAPEFKEAAGYGLNGVKRLATLHVEWFLSAIKPLLIDHFVHGYKHGWEDRK